MKVWVEKDAVTSATHSLRIKGWADSYNRWIEGDAHPPEVAEGVVKVQFKQLPFSTIKLNIPICDIRVDNEMIARFFKSRGGLGLDEYVRIERIVEKKAG